MKARIAGRHDTWLPLPTGRITPRVKQACTYYQQLWGIDRVEGEKRELAQTMLDHFLSRMERPERAEYYKFVGDLTAHVERVHTRRTSQNRQKR